MFGRLKDWRRVATRYDRCPDTYLSAIALAAIVLFWLYPERVRSQARFGDLRACARSWARTARMKRPFLVRFQIWCQAGLHRRYQLETRSGRPVNPGSRHHLIGRVHEMNRLRDLCNSAMPRDKACVIDMNRNFRQKAERPLHGGRTSAGCRSSRQRRGASWPGGRQVSMRHGAEISTCARCNVIR